ncbi:MAG: hypothetical protein CO167_01260 [Candidatus Marinimicrobia bacterium CG_4_9_14_3_um_filter_48_9]|nr:MAG: hypothetical protein CO167_01260 [Candidatus Marinimicrobia bacterium CG_4_9_14_3_um_filter_48_9]
MNFTQRFLVISLMMVLVTCSMWEDEPDTPLTFESGQQFGLCVSRCKFVATITQTNSSLNGYESVSSSEPYFTDTSPTEQSAWDTLVDRLDWSVLDTMQAVYGCPDCADGGAEWIKVTQNGVIKRITFEYGDTLDAIAPLQLALRNLRESMLGTAELEKEERGKRKEREPEYEHEYEKDSRDIISDAG